jgi:hypothetical protein
MTNINDVVTLADFAKEISVTGQTVNTWLTAHNEVRDNSFDGDGVILPVRKFGNTNVYDRKALLELAADKGNSTAVKAAGYVHPDKFAEIERNYFEALERIGLIEITSTTLNSELRSALDRLTAMEIERDHFKRVADQFESELREADRERLEQMIENSDLSE